LKTDDLALIFWSQGALRAVLTDAKGNRLATLRATRPDRRSVSVAVYEAQLGMPVRYRWLALAFYKGKPGCAKGCTDVAPNRALAIHQLAEPAALTVNVTGSGRVSGGQLHQIVCPSACRATFRKGSDVPADRLGRTGLGVRGLERRLQRHRTDLHRRDGRGDLGHRDVRTGRRAHGLGERLGNGERQPSRGRLQRADLPSAS
jgi:hypothetical protein